MKSTQSGALLSRSFAKPYAKQKHPCAPDLQLVSQSVLLDLHIDLGQDAFAMRGAPEGGQVRPDSIHQLSMQLPIGHCQGTLQHIVGIWVLQ